jgi:DNA-binding winged helix-turn-helix (wHTH) protein
VTDRLQFGAFVLDLNARELRRGDTPVPLSPKAFQLLETLVASRQSQIDNQKPISNQRSANHQ